MNTKLQTRLSIIELAEDAFHLARGVEAIAERLSAVRARVAGGPYGPFKFETEPGSHDEPLADSLSASLSAIRERLGRLDDEVNAIAMTIGPPEPTVKATAPSLDQVSARIYEKAAQEAAEEAGVARSNLGQRTRPYR